MHQWDSWLAVASVMLAPPADLCPGSWTTKRTRMTTITVLEELRAYIDPLTPEEHDALERSLLAEGCRDALVLWGDVLVDGHNRYGICQKHGIAFNTVQNPRFQSMEDVHLWMIDQHLGRRSVSDFQRGVLALRKKEILAARALAAPATKVPAAADDGPATGGAVSTEPLAMPLNTRESIAKAARISSATVAQIEKIQKAATPGLVAAVRSGEISITAAAAVATLPEEAQVAAVAGGRKELRQAARQVRETRAQQQRPAPVPAEPAESTAADAAQPAPWDDAGVADQDLSAQCQRLRDTVARLTAENDALRAQVASLSAALHGPRAA